MYLVWRCLVLDREDRDLLGSFLFSSVEGALGIFVFLPGGGERSFAVESIVVETSIKFDYSLPILICSTLLGLSLLVIVEALSVWRKSSESRLEGLRSLFLDGSGVVESLLKKLSLFYN